MSESSPEVQVALLLEHVRAGIEALEAKKLDMRDELECTRLAWRLARLGQATR